MQGRAWGRSPEEWVKWVGVAHPFLIEQASFGDLTNYTGVNTVLFERTGRRFDLTHDGGIGSTITGGILGRP
jgi:hypothetical protein